jgi:D-glycero-D-manno-heptose 1,7-bisphosphate phosphatase
VFTERAPEAIKLLHEAGYKLAVATNQSGIGHEYYTEADMRRLHEHMQAELERQAGVRVDAIAFCPHRQDAGCGCRKPETGMARQVEEQLGEIDYGQSWMVGDKEKDVEFGQRLGMKTVLVSSEYWKKGELACRPDYTVKNLFEAAQIIIGLRAKE